jgi:hypothetical protein
MKMATPIELVLLITEPQNIRMRTPDIQVTPQFLRPSLCLGQGCSLVRALDYPRLIDQESREGQRGIQVRPHRLEALGSAYKPLRLHGLPDKSQNSEPVRP